MQQVAKPFQTFEDLEAYKAAREFRKVMYSVSRRLPDFEKFELASQIRRAAVSLTNNIAEGHGRFHYLDQIKFVLQARGSLEELQDDLNVCQDENYLGDPDFGTYKEQGWNVPKLAAIAKPSFVERCNPCGTMDFGLFSRRKDCGAPTFAIASLVNGYLRWLRDRKTGQTLGLREEPVPCGNSDQDFQEWIDSLPFHPL